MLNNPGNSLEIFETPPTPIEITSQEKLEKTLKNYGVPLENWGMKSDSKTVENLLEEIMEGESTLYEVEKEGKKTLWRVVRVSATEFDYKGKILREKMQLFVPDDPENSKGVNVRNRKHTQAVSEKIKNSDGNPDGAILRGIKEELKIPAEAVQIEKLPEIKIERRSAEEQGSKPTYPGLNSIVVVHQYKAHLIDDDYYKPEGYVEPSKQPDKTRIGYFVWE